MTEVAAPAAPAAPVEAPNGGKPVFNHPAIPPLRGPSKPAVPAQAADPQVQKPDPAVEPLKALDAPIEAETPVESQVEYSPDDEFPIVVDGAEQQVTLAKLIASYQRNEAANQRFNEAKLMKNQATQLVETMMTPEGFARVCRAAGKDPLEIADRLVIEAWERERMTPEQREMHDFQREKAQHEAEMKRRQEAETLTKKQQETRAFQQRFIETSVATMDKLHIPADKGLRNELLGRAAAMYRADIQSGYETTPQAAMADAWDDYQKRLEAHTRALPVERRVTAEERAKLATQQQQERVRVAQTAPKPPTHDARGDDGKFVPKPTPKFDPWAMTPKTR